MRTIPALILFLGLCAPGPAAQPDATPLRQLPRATQEQRTAGDLRAAGIYRHGLLAATEFALRQTNLFPTVRWTDTRLPRREEKERLWQTWKAWLDYLLALDALEQYHRDWFRLSGARRDGAFTAMHAAFLAKYRCGLQLIEAAERNPVLDTVLNEPVPELGLPGGAYAGVKFRFLNVAAASEFAASRVVFAAIKTPVPPALRDGMDGDAAFILRMGCGPGETLTLKNALKILQRSGQSAWFPVQAGVAEWMGDTKVRRAGRSLISPAQIAQLLARLQPGDVLLTRREWYLSNIGLPGFWPHAALYVGTPEERRRAFATPEIAAWARAQGGASGELEDLLRTRYPSAAALSVQPQEHGHVPRVLEAMSEGVVFTTLEHSADADCVAALRPLVSAREKAAALLRAFHYAGRPYDFNFDFATDAELVCTELVFKAYEPAAGMGGLRLPLVEMLGRQVTPANEIVRQFDTECGTAAAQFEFIAFFDGREAAGRAVEAGLDEFRLSWRRPKWHMLKQGPAGQ